MCYELTSVWSWLDEDFDNVYFITRILKLHCRTIGNSCENPFSLHLYCKSVSKAVPDSVSTESFAYGTRVTLGQQPSCKPRTRGSASNSPAFQEQSLPTPVVSCLDYTSRGLRVHSAELGLRASLPRVSITCDQKIISALMHLDKLKPYIRSRASHDFDQG